ncbi:hypothetical protein [Xenorhabdus bovienii]|uniref:hypothetical protein n=1 Tax=Xenorhabdus bovienii TaxID=40576 RepID=UPI0023B2323C|nr:hypothetical protein [Xenorhabdus bovienii]MDE9480995.1 hypothetical protein [Xenorhabdus bovienii]
MSEQINFIELLEKKICPVCGEEDCSYKDGRYNHKTSKNYQKLADAYLKGKMLEVKKTTIQIFGPYASANQGLYRKGLEEERGLSSWGLFGHYRRDSGVELTLSQIGVQDQISNLIKTPGAFKKTDGTSVQSRFISQIKKGERVDFENVYSFGNESRFNIIDDPLWAIGDAKVSGNLTDVGVKSNGDKYNLSGVINYKLYDKFGDPYDIKNWTGKEWDPNGTPFDITGEWKENVNFDIDKNVYDNKIKTLIDK